MDGFTFRKAESVGFLIFSKPVHLAWGARGLFVTRALRGSGAKRPSGTATAGDGLRQLLLLDA